MEKASKATEPVTFLAWQRAKCDLVTFKNCKSTDLVLEGTVAKDQHSYNDGPKGSRLVTGQIPEQYPFMHLIDAIPVGSGFGRLIQVDLLVRKRTWTSYFGKFIHFYITFIIDDLVV